MPKITALRPKGRATDRFVVELDEKAFATIDLSIFDRFKLRVGETLESPTCDALLAAATTLAAYDRALRMLASRGRPGHDLTRRLQQKGVLAVDAKAAVERLRSQGLLDDAAFARSYVRQKSAAHGRRRLEADLSRLGVSRDDIRAALDSELAATPDDVAATVTALVARKRKSLEALDPAARHRRLLGFLARRGFGPREVAIALESLGFPKR